MKNAIATVALIAAVMTFGTQASAHNTKGLHFEGIDTSLSSHGYATIEYKGQTYHLTEGDTLAKQTIVLIDAADNQVIVKDAHGHLYEIHFTK